MDVLAAAGSGYHFFDQIAPRFIIQKQTELLFLLQALRLNSALKKRAKAA
ncbi:MAG: hypothetical protein JRF72_16335 [Deltaproteobacteria bacterium]|jgi:hypothetical protein|nr:hypothetical protein [Deltaproteobacteria bacterium]